VCVCLLIIRAVTRSGKFKGVELWNMNIVWVGTVMEKLCLGNRTDQDQDLA